MKKTLSQLFWPVFIEYTLLMLVGVIDTGMLSLVGDRAVAAAGTTNTYLYLVSMIFTIMSTGALTVMTQYIGARQEAVAHRARQIGVLVNLAVGLFFSILFLTASRPILVLMATTPVTLDEASTYMTIVGSSMALLAVTNVYSSYLRAFGHADRTMVSAAAANIFNIVFNGIFIYMGMGIFGVALATLLSRILNLVLEIVFSRQIKRGDRTVCDLDDRTILAQIVKIGLPSAGELIVFNLSISFEVRCLNQMDAAGTAIGVYSYCNQICNLIYAAAVSLSQANGIMVGWRVGEGKFEESYRGTVVAGRLGIFISGLAALFCVFVIRPLLGILTDNAEILSAAAVVMVINVFKELGRAGNYIFGTALKSSGDAAITVIMGLVSMPLCAVLGSYILGIRLGFGIYGAWIGMACDECFRCVWMYLRYRSRKWESRALVTA